MYIGYVYAGILSSCSLTAARVCTLVLSLVLSSQMSSLILNDKCIGVQNPYTTSTIMCVIMVLFINIILVLGKDYSLVHAAPIVSVFVLDHDAQALPSPGEVENRVSPGIVL